MVKERLKQCHLVRAIPEAHQVPSIMTYDKAMSDPYDGERKDFVIVSPVRREIAAEH